MRFHDHLERLTRENLGHSLTHENLGRKIFPLLTGLKGVAVRNETT